MGEFIDLSDEDDRKQLRNVAIIILVIILAILFMVLVQKSYS